jgi:hypothetical protein
LHSPFDSLFQYHYDTSHQLSPPPLIQDNLAAAIAPAALTLIDILTLMPKPRSLTASPYLIAAGNKQGKPLGLLCF